MRPGPDNPLGARIAEKRKREGLSLRDAGTSAGVAFSTLGRIEKGATPSYGVGQRIEAWLRGEAPTIQPPMTLWDHFAGQALAGIASGHDSTGMTSWLPVAAAAQAADYADAMMAERKRRQEAQL